MHFSSRTEFGTEADPLTEAVAARRRAGSPVLDLSESNPTRCGIGLRAEAVLPALADPSVLRYQAEPFGAVEAREAVATLYYAARGIAVSAANLFLTASTSETYSYLFRLFCEPGDHVLVPQPSYPLFDLLARLGDVETRPYPLRFQERWEIDLYTLEAAITPRTRAIVVVHPNNPTGHYASAVERAALDRLAARHGLPLLVDEVFLDYAVEAKFSREAPAVSFAANTNPLALTFVMSGLSKVLAMPQMKLAWTAVLGPETLCREALHRLEFIADTFLSVGTPVSTAVKRWLPHAGEAQGSVRGRVQANLAWLDRELAAQTLVCRLPVEGGWSVLLRLPALLPDGEFSARLLERAGVLVHPGSFFGLPPRGWIVLSLLLEEQHFQTGVRALLRLTEEQAGIESGDRESP